MWKGILNLSLQEYLVLTPGEFSDMISCYQIANGIAEQAEPEPEKQFIPDWR